MALELAKGAEGVAVDADANAGAGAGAGAGADEVASADVVVGRSRHRAMESRPLEAATARLPRFTASSA